MAGKKAKTGQQPFSPGPQLSERFNEEYFRRNTHNFVLAPEFRQPPPARTSDQLLAPVPSTFPIEDEASDAVNLAPLPDIFPSIQAPPRDVQQPKELAAHVLAIEPEAIGKVSKKHWKAVEDEAILGYFQRPGMFSRMKTHPNVIWKEMCSDIFQGTRSWKAIQTRWIRLREQFADVERKIKSTGEGEKDPDQWASMLTGWIHRECPNYTEIADILQRDKTYAPPMASEMGGPTARVTRDDEGEGNTELSSDSDDSDDEDEDDVHPPQGGKKDPLKTGKKLKRKRGNQQGATDDLSSEFLKIQRERLAIQREEFEARRAQREHELLLEERRMNSLRVQLQIEQLRASNALANLPVNPPNDF
ncbi:hypothetical protein BJ508DRAFT_308279 [Ascobolus immersus RN42]|uniref:Uncharacterized protein n=1 Tax=Ascobolus immersus RN42 TaxID=1160509 RepID=A0A3N4I249_ASCIM|nr:hypothetical protein BJ508DRAFT_308279 [Ascobolus immersus RN42]